MNETTTQTPSPTVRWIEQGMISGPNHFTDHVFDELDNPEQETTFPSIVQTMSRVTETPRTQTDRKTNGGTINKIIRNIEISGSSCENIARLAKQEEYEGQWGQSKEEQDSSSQKGETSIKPEGGRCGQQ